MPLREAIATWEGIHVKDSQHTYYYVSTFAVWIDEPSQLARLCAVVISCQAWRAYFTLAGTYRVLISGAVRKYHVGVQTCYAYTECLLEISYYAFTECLLEKCI